MRCIKRAVTHQKLLVNGVAATTSFCFPEKRLACGQLPAQLLQELDLALCV